MPTTVRTVADRLAASAAQKRVPGNDVSCYGTAKRSGRYTFTDYR